METGNLDFKFMMMSVGFYCFDLLLTELVCVVGCFVFCEFDIGEN